MAGRAGPAGRAGTVGAGTGRPIVCGVLSPPAPRLDAVRAGPGARVAVRVLLLGAVATLAAVAFVLAPVRQPEVTYTWTPADGSAVALPLMPYQPVTLTATVSCAAARAGVRLSTVPPVPDPEAAPLAGLTLVGTPADVAVTSGGTALGPVALPAGDCTLLLTSDAAATTVSIDGAPVLRHDGDVRPDVAGVFGDGFTGGTAAVTVVADTRFATTPTPVKLGLGAVCLLALAGLGGALARADRRWSTRRVRLLPRGVARPRTVDAAVTALLLVWWAVGAGTVDDGYLAGIVRGRAENGFVGNAYRWLNAPEAPFSWFVEPYHWWTLAAPSGVPSTPWMRLPSTLLGLVCWVLVSRLLVPRLGSAGRRRGTAWVAALAFGTWWVPFGLGLRPEPWVAVGAVLVFVAVERALATGRVLPLAAALTAAGTTAAVTPGGLLAFAPVLAAAVPLLRRQRARTDLQLTGAWPALPLLAVIVAAPAAALLLMAADQGAAALAEAVRVRGVIGGGRPWAEESVRYALLLTPGEIQGTIGRRAAVLTTVLAAAALAWVLAGRGGPRAGIAPGPTRRLLVTLALAAVAMTFSPTKWTQHFGALAGLGTAVLTLGLVAFGPRAWRAVARHDPALARRQRVAGLGAVTAVGALVLAGRNAWPFVGAWYTPTFSTLPPQVPVPGGDVPVSTLVIAVGGAVTAAALARSAWRRSGTGSAFRTPGRGAGARPSPGRGGGGAPPPRRPPPRPPPGGGADAGACETPMSSVRRRPSEPHRPSRWPPSWSPSWPCRCCPSPGSPWRTPTATPRPPTCGPRSPGTPAACSRPCSSRPIPPPASCPRCPPGRRRRRASRPRRWTPAARACRGSPRPVRARPPGTRWTPGSRHGPSSSRSPGRRAGSPRSSGGPGRCSPASRWAAATRVPPTGGCPSRRVRTPSGWRWPPGPAAPRPARSWPPRRSPASPC